MLNYEKSKPSTKRASGELTPYLNSLHRYPILSREDEKAVAILAATGDKKAIDKLIQSNLLLVVKIANEYKPMFNGVLDLIQEGNIGLVSSIRKYDHTRGHRFGTFAASYARFMMLRYIFDNSHMIRPSKHSIHGKLFYSLRREQKRLEKLGITPDTATLASNLNVPEQDVIDMENSSGKDVSLDMPGFNNADGQEVAFGNNLTASPAGRPDIIMEEREYASKVKLTISDFVERLKNDRYRDVFYRRILTEKPETLESIGQKHQVSRERIRQIEATIRSRFETYMRRVLPA